MIHQYKKATFGAYEVLDAFEDRDGEECVICRDWEGTFELTGASVHRHKNIDQATYIALNKAARLQAIDSNYEAWEADLQRNTQKTISEDDLFYLGNRTDKSCTSMNADDLKVILSLAYQIDDEQIDNTFETVQKDNDSLSACAAFTKAVNQLIEKKDPSSTRFVEPTEEAFLNHCLSTKDTALIQNATNLLKGEHALQTTNHAPEVYWLNTVHKGIHSGTHEELLDEWTRFYGEFRDILDKDIKRSMETGQARPKAVCEAVKWVTFEYGSQNVQYEAFSNLDNLLDYCKHHAKELLEEAQQLVDAKRPQPTKRQGRTM